MKGGQPAGLPKSFCRFPSGLVFGVFCMFFFSSFLSLFLSVAFVLVHSNVYVCLFVCLSVFLLLILPFLSIMLFADQPLDVWTKTQLKIRKTKIGKKDFEEKTRQETKIEKILMKENFVIEYFDVVLFMKQKEERKGKKTKTKKLNKTKKKDKKEERQKKREKQRKRKWKKGGGQKRLRENKGRQAKTNIKCPFLGEKNRVLGLLEAKKGKETKQQKKNEEGLGPSELALRFFFFFLFFFFVFPFFFFGLFWGFDLFSFFLLLKNCNRLSVPQTPSLSKVRSLLVFFLRVCFSVYLLKTVFICLARPS